MAQGGLAVHAVLVLVQVLFASLAISGKFVLGEFAPGGLVLMRIWGAAVVLGLGHLLWGGRWIRDRGDLRELAVLAMLGVVANQGLFLLGLDRTTAINATLLVSTIPVFTVLHGVLTRTEPPSWLKFLGIGLAGAGVIYLIGPDRITLAPETALGNAMIVAGMFGYSLYLVRSRRLLAKYPPMTVSVHVMLFAAIGAIPLGVQAALTMDLGAVRPVTWAWVGYIILGPTILAYVLNIWALKRVPSNLVAAYIYLQPLVTAGLAPLLLPDERITPRAVWAGLGIFAGLATVIAGEHRQRRQIPAPSLPGE